MEEMAIKAVAIFAEELPRRLLASRSYSLPHFEYSGAIAKAP
jgi:hypothetical protein